MSDLRHKTPDELREVIAHEECMIAHGDIIIPKLEKHLEEARKQVELTEEALGKHRMWRNGHRQRLVWAKNYLLTKNSG